MGMQFSPMYQPVSTKTIKADGDLNISPYDITAYDGSFDTVEADEFVGGVGNFSSTTVRGTLNDTGIKIGSYTQSIEPISYSGTLDIAYGVSYTIGSITTNDLSFEAQYLYYNIGELVSGTYPINLTISASAGSYTNRLVGKIYVNDVLAVTTGTLDTARTVTINVKNGDNVRIDLFNNGAWFGSSALANVTFTCNGDVYLL